MTNTYFNILEAVNIIWTDQEHNQSIKTIDILKPLPYLPFLFMASMSEYKLSKAVNMDDYMAVNWSFVQMGFSLGKAKSAN